MSWRWSLTRVLASLFQATPFFLMEQNQQHGMILSLTPSGIQTALHVALKVVSLSGAAAATGHNPGITVTIALKGKTYLMMNDSRSGNIICRINGIKTR